MTNTAPKKFDRPFTMRVDERFHEEVKELRQLADEFPPPSQSDVIRKAVTLALELRRKEVARRGKSK